MSVATVVAVATVVVRPVPRSTVDDGRHARPGRSDDAGGMTSIRVSGLPELLSVLPYSLGFRPRRCVVAVTVTGGRLGVVARLDPSPAGPVAGLTQAVVRPLLREAPEAVILVGYVEQPADPVDRLLEQLAGELAEAGRPVGDQVLVRAGRWRRRDDLDAGRWLALPDERDVPAVAEFVALERVVVPDREALRAAVEPGTDPGRLSTECVEAAMLQRASSDPGRLADQRRHDFDDWAAWQRAAVAEPWRAPVPDRLARLVASLTDVTVRDAVIAWLAPGSLPPEAFDATVRRDIEARLPALATQAAGDGSADVLPTRALAGLEAMCRRTPPRWAVPVLTVTAACRWWAGDGARARVAVGRALIADPGYRLAALVEQLLDHAVRPGEPAGAAPGRTVSAPPH